MQFSIVITTHNRLSLLKKALESALAQTLPCEVVVVDDCSTDGTEAYIQSLIAQMEANGDRRLVYHRNPVNLGHSRTMNAGVQAARGEWIKPVDDDDYLQSNCIAEISQAIATHPPAVICSCQAIQVDSQGVEVTKTRQVGSGTVVYIPQEDIHYGMLLEQVPFGTPIQVAFRRDIFLKTGGWDSSLDVNFDDIDSWIKIAQFGDAIFINQYLAYRTLWPGAENQRISLPKRLQTNIAIKQKIYHKVSEKYRDRLPAFPNIKAYLHLHWSLVALKRGKIATAFQMAFPAFFSIDAWKLLLNAKLTAKKPIDPSSPKI